MGIVLAAFVESLFLTGYRCQRLNERKKEILDSGIFQLTPL